MEKIIVVTGGGRGIGKEIVRQLAGKGHRLLAGVRDVAKGKESLKGYPGNIEVLPLDLSDESSIAAFAEEVKATSPHVDVLINNAGVLLGSAGLDTVAMSDLHATFGPNFFGPLYLSQCLLPLLRKSSDARIVHLSSQMGGQDALVGGYAAYRLSRASLNMLTQLMANEWRKYDIKVNAMCPGWVKTDMGGAGAALTVEQGADTAVWLATADQIPTGKFISQRKVRPW